MSSPDPAAPPPTTGALAPALDQRFDVDGLYALRSAVAAHATDLGAGTQAVSALTIIVGELASNAVRHGGGSGRLQLWSVDGLLYLEVADTGPGLADPAGAGRTPPQPAASGGRGLWIVRHLARDVGIDTGPGGTTVTVAVPVS